MDSTPAPTPLNGNVVATSATRLGLTVHETPASVDIVSQEQMREQGYRTTTETAAGATGVQAADVGGAPASFSMRGFTFNEVNVLYNGISIGPSATPGGSWRRPICSRSNSSKDPSAIMSGLDAIGGSVNFVSKQPTTGPIKSELDTSIDTLGTYRTHFGSGGSTNVSGLDYRFDVSSSKIASFIDGDYQNLNNVSGQLNYRVNDAFKVFARDRLQERRRPRLLGHAADHDGVLRTVLHPRRGRGLGDQHLRRLPDRPGDRGLADADDQLQRRRQFHRRA